MLLFAFFMKCVIFNFKEINERGFIIMFPSNRYWQKMTGAVSLFIYKSKLPGLIHRLTASEVRGRYDVVLLIRHEDREAWRAFLKQQGFEYFFPCSRAPFEGIGTLHVKRVKL